MLLARRGPNCDIHMVVSNDRASFFCIHADRTSLRVWEPVAKMNVNEAYYHAKMHMTLGHKVPEGLLDLIQVQYLRQD